MATIKMQKVGFDNIIKLINEKGLDVHKAAENALLKSHEYITKEIKETMKKGVSKKQGGKTQSIDMNRKGVNRGEMKSSFHETGDVMWTGDTASIKVGFDQNKSMHFTYIAITGNAYIKPKNELYRAIYGAKTKKAIKEIQEKEIMKVLEGGY